MKMIIKNIMTSMGINIQVFAPEISDNFQEMLFLTVGFDDQGGGHDYTLSICTPTWLEHCVENMGPTSGRHMLIVNHYDHNEILSSIEKIIDGCQRSDRAEAQAVLGRFFAWEYEDYKM